MICVSQAWYSPKRGGNYILLVVESFIWCLHCCLDCNRVWYTLSQRNTCLFILLSNTDWSGMWVSAKVYGSVYVYWNPLSVGILAFWFYFSFIVFLWIPASIRWLAPYWCLQKQFHVMYFRSNSLFSHKKRHRHHFRAVQSIRKWLATFERSPVLQDTRFEISSLQSRSMIVFLPAWWLRVLRDS